MVIARAAGPKRERSPVLDMKRREFITLLGGAAAAWPLAARAQQPGKLPTMGIIGSGTAATQSHWYAAFVQRLRELGWIDGRSVAVEYRWAEGRDERFVEMAAEFVQRRLMSLSHHRLSDLATSAAADPVIIGQGLYTS
jgi:hypothetical protein